VVGTGSYTFWKPLADKFPSSTPEGKSSWQGITETWMNGRPNAASLWARCITIPPKLDHSRLAKLSSPRLLAPQQSLQVIDKDLGLPRPTEPAIQVLRVTLRVGRTMPRRRRAHSLPPDL
jgi:hypothetical protein